MCIYCASCVTFEPNIIHIAQQHLYLLSSGFGTYTLQLITLMNHKI